MAEAKLVPFTFDGDDVRAVVTTREGGVSTGAYRSLNVGDHVHDDHALVVRNRRRVAEALGVDAVTIADQQHSATCAVVTPELAGAGFEGDADAKRQFRATDALVTDVPGAALGVMIADCVPIVLWDPAHRAAGVVHAGRRGVVLGVVDVAVRRMHDEFGTAPADLRVGLGPCVGLDSYEVEDELARPLEERYPGAGLTRPSASDRPGHSLIDLGGAVEQQLLDLSVPEGRIDRMRIDTRVSDMFFSHRAERPCGRFMAVVALPA
jgi:YfiH family protein